MNLELKDTIEMMQSEDHKERFRAEFAQLEIRCKKLNTMLDEYCNGTLKFEPKCSYGILYEQYVAMKRYRRLLLQRAVLEGITISDLKDDSIDA